MRPRLGIVRRRFIGCVARTCGVWALVLVGSVFAQDDPLQQARDALERGDAAGAAAAASAVILSAPGDARLADAQRLLGLAHERAGALAAAWEQYHLFLKNFPLHPARDDVADRADALVQRARERPVPPPTRWRAVSAGAGRWDSSDDAAVVTVADSDDREWVGARVTRAAVDGARIWVRLEPAGVFDPFDEETVARVERRVQAAAAWPIEGLVFDRVTLGEGVSSPAADRAYADLARDLAGLPAAGDRLIWTWAGMRARASAAALRRFVAAATTVNPRIMCAIRISADAVFRPERAVREAGEDWAALRVAAPAAMWAIDAPANVTSRLAAALSPGEARLPLARWTEDGGMVRLR
ncbi:MAG: hypothetical protein ACOYXU_01120 [Nitrospirota bacterium]